ncbi:MAG: phosphoenolpyruvate carboxykinase (ATP) [Theionarchaea archaeon]|nr:phosphoenolpyruvate carboxykinase (ATP) [Theionarchaea archaeon]MBU7038257.1 phosphoenolpyruvate carboxykinase (ATP) [Theionarchaea archaeon]
MLEVEPGYYLDESQVMVAPQDQDFMSLLKDYYVITKDGQYLFASQQTGRRPDRVFYMVPPGYRLGKNQKAFDPETGHQLYAIVKEYLRTVPTIVQDGIQGDPGYETGIRVVISIENPHSAYLGWFGKLMIFPPKKSVKVSCFNYIVPERLPTRYITKIRSVWPDYSPGEPITLYDFTGIETDVRRVISLGVDYFGGAYKKPNLTMVWNRGEYDGLISYHAGCTRDMVMKGLSGTGKTTLTVGPTIEQDDALLGIPEYTNGRIARVRIIGLEAASFAKSEELTPESPEWEGLMKSRSVESGTRHIVLALNIDCEGVFFVTRTSGNHRVRVPLKIPGHPIGSLLCTDYTQSRTTNGRFIFQFNELNKEWSREPLYLRCEGLAFKRATILDPVFRVLDPLMAVALDSACETKITSAIAGQTIGKKVMSYAATDFMAGEESRQALLKLTVYQDLGLDFSGGLLFFIVNSGYYGSTERKKGEKIPVKDTKRLIDLVIHKRIKKWLPHPIFRYLIPHPEELECEHCIKNYARRFNPLNYYSPEKVLELARRDIKERTAFLEGLFGNEEGGDELYEVIHVWDSLDLPTVDELEAFYEAHYAVTEEPLTQALYWF